MKCHGAFNSPANGPAVSSPPREGAAARRSAAFASPNRIANTDVRAAADGESDDDNDDDGDDNDEDCGIDACRGPMHASTARVQTPHAALYPCKGAPTAAPLQLLQPLVSPLRFSAAAVVRLTVGGSILTTFSMPLKRAL